MYILYQYMEISRWVQTCFLFVGFLIYIMYFSSTAYAIGIGTIPGVLDLGEVRRGQEIVGTFYITSTLEEPMKIRLTYMDPHYTIYTKEKTRAKNGYNFVPSEASEESIEGWIEFPKNEILINPKEIKTIKTPQGTVRYNTAFKFILRIPEDAEPGYHAGSINIIPVLEKESARGTSISTLGLTRPYLVFKVSGNAIRKGRIISIEARRLDDKRVRVDVLFKNEGTVTITAKLNELVIYDDFGYKTGNIAMRTSQKIKPGEVGILSAYWIDNKGIESGSYKADVVVDYITDKVEYTGYLKVLDEIYVPKEGQLVKEQKDRFPWWFLLIIMGLIALYIYWKM